MIVKEIESIDIRSHLSRIRSGYEALHNSRIDEIYSKIPEIKNIDDSLSDIAISEAKNRLMGNPKDEALSEKLGTLSEKKKELLRQNGFPEDYLEPIFNCPICKDWGEIDGKVCSCVRNLRVSELYKRSNLKNVFERENFSTFSLDNYSKVTDPQRGRSPHENATHILKKAKTFVDNFDKEHGNILIYGSTGLGKTFLSNCIAKALLDKGHSVLYLSANELFEDILSTYIMSHSRSSALEAIYNYLYSSDLLIIDDLGTEVMSSFTRSQLFEIINKRMLSNLSTIITTNLDLETLQDRYTERVMSRFAKSYVLYPLFGDDIRYRKHLNNMEENQNA
ncbi:MAG: ATP-binding protein [Eubacterium sp.]|nr:ATP-binding protein [Eubacterium sp.]